MVTKPRLYGLAILGAMILAGCNDDPAPTGGGGSGSGGSMTLSDPKSAAKSFMTAIVNGDAAAAKASSVSGSPQQQEALEAMVHMTSAATKFSTAAKAKFGDSSKVFNMMAAGPAAEFEKMNKQIDEAEIKIEGDTATLTHKAHGEPLKLKKQAGAWKMDLASMPLPPATELAQMKKMAKGMETIAADIKAGKYTQPEQVMEAMSKMGE